MRREIVNLKPGIGPGDMSSDCPIGTFNSVRSKRARSKAKKAEHQHVKAIVRSHLSKELTLEDNALTSDTEIANLKLHLVKMVEILSSALEKVEELEKRLILLEKVDRIRSDLIKPLI